MAPHVGTWTTFGTAEFTTSASPPAQGSAEESSVSGVLWAVRENHHCVAAFLYDGRYVGDWAFYAMYKPAPFGPTFASPPIEVDLSIGDCVDTTSTLMPLGMARKSRLPLRPFVFSGIIVGNNDGHVSAFVMLKASNGMYLSSNLSSIESIDFGAKGMFNVTTDTAQHAFSTQVAGKTVAEIMATEPVSISGGSPTVPASGYSPLDAASAAAAGSASNSGDPVPPDGFPLGSIVCKVPIETSFHTLSKVHIQKSLNLRNFGTRRPGTHPAHAYASINPLLDVRTTSVTHLHGILHAAASSFPVRL